MSKFIYDFGDPVYIEPFHSVYFFFFLFLILLLCQPRASLGGFITGPDELTRQGVNFTWSDVRSKTLRIVVEYFGDNGTPRTGEPRLGISHIVGWSFRNCLPRHEILSGRRKNYERFGKLCGLLQVE
jgi:hypothetical protein